MKVYGDYTQEELNRQYTQQALVPNMLEYIGQNKERSEAIRQRLPCELDIPYGPALDERLDIFFAEQRGASIQIYHHGGAWTSTSKKNYSYIASSFHIKGITLIIPDFSLAPKVTLDEMVRQNRAAIAWTFHNAQTFGGDNSRIYISGHSSGGHLVGKRKKMIPESAFRRHCFRWGAFISLGLETTAAIILQMAIRVRGAR